MTQKEAVLALLRGEKPDIIVDGWAPFQPVFDDALLKTTGSMPGTTIVDAWGVTMVWEEGQPGTMPSEDPALLACTDITEWRDQITVPRIREWEYDWGSAFGQKAGAEAQGKFAAAFMPCGIFEEAHHILGFEECLVDLLAEPDDMHDLIDELFDFKKALIELRVNSWKPECFILHDDFGSKDSLLMPPDTWREYFKEGYREMCKMIHDAGAFVILHSDSKNDLIAADLEEVGIDIWQGALPECDIEGMQKSLKKLVFMGGFDSAVYDGVNSTPEQVEADVRNACEKYLPGGRFIPSITYGLPGTIIPGRDEIISKVIEELNAGK